MADASMQCYYLDGARNQQGPVAGAEIARLVRSGTISRDTLIWHPGMTDWRPAGQVNEFASLFSASPMGAPPMRPPMAPGGAGAMRAPAAAAASFGGYDPHAAGTDKLGPTGFSGAVKTCLSKYVDFSGRAARPEFWFFALFQVLLFIVFMIAGGLVSAANESAGGAIIVVGYLVVGLGLFLPGLSATVRRLHDTDRSGWWYLISFVPFGSIVLLIFLCLRGTEGPNQYGPPVHAPL